MNFETAHAEPKQRGQTPPKVSPPPAQAPPPSSSPPRAEQSSTRPAAENPAPARSYWWVWLIVVLVVGVGGYFAFVRIQQSRAQATGTGGGPGGSGKAGAASRPVPVVAVPAREGDLKIYLNGIGTVTPVNTAAIHTRVDGQLTKVAYTEGQIVHHDPAYDGKTMADLDKASADKSDLLVEVDPRPYEVQLEQAKGQLARDQAQLHNAQLDLQRFTQLYAQKSTTEQQLQTQQALVAQDQAVLQVDQAAIHNAELQLDYCHIRTPIDGRVGLRLVDAGNIVHATDANPVAVVTQLEPITVQFTLPQDDIPQVMKSASDLKGLPVEAWNRDFKVKVATGTLEAIDNQVDPGSGTILLRAVFENKDNALFPKQFVNARLLVDTLKNVVIVPSAAVQRSPSSTFVYVVKPDETVTMQDVKVGPSEADETAIETGLTPGQIVVTDGVDKLQSGTKVTTHAPAGGKGGKGNKGNGAAGTTNPATNPMTNPTTNSGAGDPNTTQPANEEGASPAPGAAPAAGHGRHRPG